jgi:hypothetical protein
MHLVYIDDSGDEQLTVFSALVIPADEWRSAFQQLQNLRRRLKQSYGIYVRKELHAWKFVTGKGRIADRVVFKSQRAGIFKDTLRVVAALPGIQIFNAVFPRRNGEMAFERLLNRINRTMQAWGSQALLICDEGKEAIYTRMVRRMSVYNPIPSQYGQWEDGNSWRNIPLERILEDPFFKDSSRSYFIQAADFVAYALLRQEHQLPSRNKYGIQEAFNLLESALFTGASRRDPRGIIRP